MHFCCCLHLLIIPSLTTPLPFILQTSLLFDVLVGGGEGSGGVTWVFPLPPPRPVQPFALIEAGALPCPATPPQPLPCELYAPTWVVFQVSGCFVNLFQCPYFLYHLALSLIYISLWFVSAVLQYVFSFQLQFVSIITAISYVFCFSFVHAYLTFLVALSLCDFSKNGKESSNNVLGNYSYIFMSIHLYDHSAFIFECFMIFPIFGLVMCLYCFQSLKYSILCTLTNMCL